MAEILPHPNKITAKDLRKLCHRLSTYWTKKKIDDRWHGVAPKNLLAASHHLAPGLFRKFFFFCEIFFLITLRPLKDFCDKSY